jgi:hypothetical protein
MKSRVNKIKQAYVNQGYKIGFKEGTKQGLRWGFFFGLITGAALVGIGMGVFNV